MPVANQPATRVVLDRRSLRILLFKLISVRWPSTISLKIVLYLVILAMISSLVLQTVVIVASSSPIQTVLRTCLMIWWALTGIGRFLSFSSHTVVALSSRLLDLRCIVVRCSVGANPLESAIDEVEHARTLIGSTELESFGFEIVVSELNNGESIGRDFQDLGKRFRGLADTVMDISTKARNAAEEIVHGYQAFERKFTSPKGPIKFTKTDREMRKLLLEKVDGSLSDLKANTELAKQEAEMILSVATSTREKLIWARTRAESKLRTFKSRFFTWLKWKFSFVLGTKEGVEGDQLHSDLQLARDGMEVVQGAQNYLTKLSTFLTEFRGTVRNAMKTNEWGRYHGAPDEMVLVAFRKGLRQCLHEIESLHLDAEN